MRKFLAVVVVGSIVALGMPSAAFAASGKLHSQQIQFGTINGTVRSANGDPLPNHKVRARDAAGNIVGQATSNAAGSYSIAGLQPGNYLIEARATDKTGYTQTALQDPPEPNGASGYPSTAVTVVG